MNITFNLQPKDQLAVYAIIISIISLISSIAFEILANYRENKAFESGLESSYYDEIFRMYLIEIIPKARHEIIIANLPDSSCQILKGIDSLADCLEELRKSALYFFYADSGFYESLDCILQKCVDHLYKYSNAPGFSPEKAGSVLSEISNDLEELYSCILKKHRGGKFKKTRKCLVFSKKTTRC